MALVASSQFFEFCARLHQDVTILHGPEPADWIRGALQYTKKDDLVKLRSYLAGLVDGPYSDAELQELFRSTYTDMGIREDRGVRVFFQVVVDIIDGKPAQW